MNCKCNCKCNHKCKGNGLLFEYCRLPQAHHLNPFTCDSSYPYTPAAAIPLINHGIVPFENSLVVEREHYISKTNNPISVVPPLQPYYIYYWEYQP